MVCGYVYEGENPPEFCPQCRAKKEKFEEIIEGKHDDLPESAFLFAGTIDEVVEKAGKAQT